MNLHTADVHSRLTRYLDRRQMPKRVDGKPQAMQDELSELCDAVERVAPRGQDALAAWWPEFERKLSEIGGTFWPTIKEIRDAANDAGKAMPQQSAWRLDPAEMAARAMQDGRAVGEGWVYGICAVELAARRLIERETMERYRSAAFLSRRATYGEEAALAWEADAKARHEQAKEVYRSREAERTQRQVNIPAMGV